VSALTVVYGPFEALEDAFAARVRDLNPGPGAKPLLVVAPSRALSDRLERLLAVEKGLATLGVRFETFHGLADLLLDEGGPLPGAKLSDPVFHDAVLDRALDRAPRLAPARNLRARALASSARASVRDLSDAGVDANNIAEHFGSELLRDPDEAARLNDLLSVSAAYESELGRLGVLAPSSLIKLAAERARSSPFLDSFKEIIYYGAYDFTGLQLELFESVTSVRPSRLYFPYRKGHPAFRFADDLFETRLSGASLEESVPPSSVKTALGPVLDSLFDPGRPPARPAGSVQIVSASGARDEAWAAAKEAARLVAAGVPHQDIAVIARQLEPYRAALSSAFAAEGVPLDLSCGEPILRRPLAKACLDLLNLRRRDFPARSVEGLIGSPYFDARGGRVNRWRRLIDGLGIRAGWLQWRGKLESRAGGDVELRPDRAKEGLPGLLIAREDVSSLWSFVSGVRESLGGADAKWSERANASQKIISERLSLPRDADEAERDAWTAVHDALNELAAFDRLNELCSWDDFLDAFERKLSRAERPAGTGVLAVRALDAMDARGHRFSAVILIGLREKLFPRQIQEDPILREPARAALRHPAGYWIARKAAGHEEERLLFYLSCAAAKDSLTAVFPRSDEEGKAVVPSTYLRELCRAAGLPPPGEGESWRVARQPAARLRALPPERRTPREASLLAAFEGASPDPALYPADPGAKDLSAALARAAVLSDAPAPGPHDGLTRPPLAELEGWRRRGLSPTALDQYAQCPFRFFASRVLGLGERERGSERGELTPQARGIVYHDALERFHKSLPPGFWSTKAPWDDQLRKALEATFAENDWRALGVYPLLWESAREKMSAHLRDFVAWDALRLRAGGPAPVLFEERLSGEPAGGAPGGVPWTGVADRVDEDAEGNYRVVDYKTRSSARLSKDLAKKAAAGELHQLPIYAELAGPRLGLKRRFSGAELLFIEAGEDQPRSGVLSAEDWDKARPFFLAKLAARVEAASNGRFPIRPAEGQGGHCDWCDFPTVCRKSHGPSRGRALRIEVP
jgi:ATP-dependent helicase/nuclease subunit B